MTNSTIKFIEAKKESDNEVSAKYLISDQEVTVSWNNLHEGTGEIMDSFDLTLDVKSEDERTTELVKEAINQGEDSDIYLFIRDTFNAGDAAEIVAQ